MGMIRAGRLAAKILKQEGVEHVFTLTGGHIMSILQGCEDEGIRVVDTRHEQAAVFMAAGWARATGKPGVAAVTAGPGVANAVTGLWQASGNCVPIVVFGGRSEFFEFELGSLQDTDSLAMAKSCTKWARAGYEAKRVGEYTSMAFRHALAGRMGPAYIEFPVDILNAQVEESEVELPQNYRSSTGPQGDPALIKEAVDLLLNAEKPAIRFGAGVWWSQAAKELQEFVELTKIPASASSPTAEGIIPADHAQFENRSAQDADVVLFIGGRIDFRGGFARGYSKESKWIQVDIEASEIGHIRPIEVGIVGDVKAVLKQMLEEARGRCEGRDAMPWVAEIKAKTEKRQAYLDSLTDNDEAPIHPARLCKEVSDFLDRDATLSVDGGDIAVFADQLIPRYLPGHFLRQGRTGTLGIGEPFAMAAKLARPTKQALVITGDGSFGFNAMEIDTMVRHNIPVVVVVSNNQCWGMIKGDRKEKVVSTELAFTRYDKMVEALGGHGELVETPAEIRPALERAFASGLPACINVKTGMAPFRILWG